MERANSVGRCPRGGWYSGDIGIVIAHLSSIMSARSTNCDSRRACGRAPHHLSGLGDENSWRVPLLLLAVVLATSSFGFGCQTRRPQPGLGVDGGAGDSMGAAGSGAGGGAGTGGLGGAGTGGSGGASGTAGASKDGGLDCSNVGCGAPPLCSVGCRAACGCCPCADGARAGDLVCTGGCYAPSPLDASVDLSVDPHPDGSPRDQLPDGAVCEGLSASYQAAVRVAQECTPGAAGQCAMPARASFFCNCMTFVNAGADALAAMAANYRANGCQTVCTGICVQQQALTCRTDPTSTTGGRCQVPGVLNLQASNDGGTFSVVVGEEIDITLESLAPGSFSTEPWLSSDMVTVLEVNIPAGPPNPYGTTRLYRLRVLSAGQVTIRIPFEPLTSGTPKPSYAVTIDAR